MKSYFANSVQVAMEQARRELGSDATLVTSHSAGAVAQHLGDYEVVFATELPETGATDGRAESGRTTLVPAAAPALSSSALDSMLKFGTCDGCFSAGAKPACVSPASPTGSAAALSWKKYIPN